jgi:hypothetical protein
MTELGWNQAWESRREDGGWAEVVRDDLAAAVLISLESRRCR